MYLKTAEELVMRFKECVKKLEEDLGEWFF